MYGLDGFSQDELTYLNLDLIVSAVVVSAFK